jgi:hypothetical protein
MMKELIVLIVSSGIVFLIFLSTLLIGLLKKNRKFTIAAVVLFFIVILLSTWTGIIFLNTTYRKINSWYKPRTGEEIYDALFHQRQTGCVKALNWQDQIIPRIDDAIWLEVTICPLELKRILSKHMFSVEKTSSSDLGYRIPLGEALPWFKPTTLGDTVMIYEYSSDDNRTIQTIWSNVDSTHVFIRDIVN